MARSIESLDNGRVSFARREEQAAEPEIPAVRDPVCGMEVLTADAAAASEYEGRTFYFCSHACQARFDDRPAKFVPASTDAADEDGGAWDGPTLSDGRR